MGWEGGGKELDFSPLKIFSPPPNKRKKNDNFVPRNLWDSLKSSLVAYQKKLCTKAWRRFTTIDFQWFANCIAKYTQPAL